MRHKRRVISLVGAGPFAWIAAAVFPYEAVLIPKGNDWLSYQTSMQVARGEYVETRRHTCVSDFKVLADGVISFTVEPSLRTPHSLGSSVGKRLAVSTADFTLLENSETCRRG